MNTSNKILIAAAAFMSISTSAAMAKGMDVSFPKDVSVASFYSACGKSGGTKGKDKSGNVTCTGAGSGNTTCSTAPDTNGSSGGNRELDACYTTRKPPKKWNTAGGNGSNSGNGNNGNGNAGNGNSGGNTNTGGRPASADGAGDSASAATGNTGNGGIN